jgi:alpha-L-fucosidase
MKIEMSILLAACAMSVGSVSAGFDPSWESLEKKTTPEWYNNAKFGIFCHWGIQCAAEDGDWYARTLYDPNHWQGKHFRERYGDPKEGGVTELIRRWKGENWNPDELCALYRKMGATFILAMANHHDNFDNWSSTYQPWNAVNMGPKRDVLGAWSAAARKNGLRFGTSFHAAHAWTWLEVSRDYDGLLTKEDGQGKWWEGYDPQQLYWQNHEPSPNYKNLGLIHRRWNWGDGASRPSDEFMENFRLRTMDAIAKYKPDLIYFDDTVVPFWGVANLQGAHPGLRIVADFYNQNPDAVAAGKCLDESQRKAMTWDVERGTPPTPMFPKWQTDTCIGNWHYERSVYERGRYKSAADVVRLLVDVVSKNGNLCLSIPIRSDGTIDEKERKVCEDVAAWMATNRAAIFDTVPYEICGEGPQIANAPELRAQGFNEGRIPRPGKNDVRYLKAKDGACVYAVELAPDGKAPHCPALEAKGLKLVRSFEPKPGFPVVHVFE